MDENGSAPALPNVLLSKVHAHTGADVVLVLCCVLFCFWPFLLAAELCCCAADFCCLFRDSKFR